MKLNVFEANRLEKIHMLAYNYTWCHIEGPNNPADVYSRGIYASELLKNKMYLEGPPNLKKY